jgi:uncharacterized RDD family membrane protein YckC
VAASHPSEPRPLRLRAGSSTFGLDADRLIVGRSRSCDLRLRDDSVSRLHAVLYWRGEELVVEDSGSSNGTFVNRERIAAPTRLAEGDILTLGTLRLAVELVAAALPSPADDPLLRTEGDYTVGLLAPRPAGFGWRLLAWLLDTVLFAVGSLIPFAPLLAIVGAERHLLSPEALPPSLQTKAWLAGGCTVLWLLYVAYYVLHGWARRGGTPGLRLLGLRLVDWKHQVPIGYLRALLRALALVVTFLTLGIGFLLPLFRRDRKALHDLLAGTSVTHRRQSLGGAATAAYNPPRE